MTLIRWKPHSELWDPFANLADIREEMSRFFDGAFVPAVDVVEEKDNFLVKIDLPGLSKDDVNVTLQDNFLTVKGEKKHEAETKDANFYRKERVYGSFSRTVELPASVDAKRIDAHFKDGVLQVRLPKTEEAKPKQIEVKVS